MVDADGVSGKIREYVVDERGTEAVVVELRSGMRVTLPADLLHHHDDGGYTIAARWAQLARTPVRRAGVRGEPLDIPVIVEEARVGVRQVERERVRITRRVVTEDQVIETPLVDERVTVERIACDRFVDRIPEPRREGDTLIIPRVEEVAVVEKRLHLREELRIRVVREQRIDRRTIPVRRHEIEIHRDPAPGTPRAPTNPKK